MAIHRSGSIEKEFDVILNKRKALYMKQYAEALGDRLQEDAEEWQRDVRELLSEPVQGTYGTSSYVPNKSLYPRKNKGRLVNAILVPKITKRYSSKSFKLRRNQVRYTLTNFYGERVRTIGVRLDAMRQMNPNAPGFGRKKTFSGWMKRVKSVWTLIMFRRDKQKLTIGGYF